MEITPGWILTFSGAAGTLICLALLIYSGKLFRRQRKKLLYEIEEE